MFFLCVFWAASSAQISLLGGEWSGAQKTRNFMQIVGTERGRGAANAKKTDNCRGVGREIKSGRAMAAKFEK